MVENIRNKKPQTAVYIGSYTKSPNLNFFLAIYTFPADTILVKLETNILTPLIIPAMDFSPPSSEELQRRWMQHFRAQDQKFLTHLWVPGPQPHPLHVSMAGNGILQKSSHRTATKPKFNTWALKHWKTQPGMGSHLALPSATHFWGLPVLMFALGFKKNNFPPWF